MKKIYYIGDDIFIVVAFVAFVVAGVLTVLGIPDLFWNITTNGLINLSVISLFFSSALSLYELAHKK
jgi:hypothetical protein